MRSCWAYTHFDEILYSHRNPSKGKERFELVREQEKEEFNLLIQDGVDVNLSGTLLTELRRYPLEIAVAMGNLHIAKLLIKHGADINAGGSLVFQARSLDSLKFCLDNGADIHVMDGERPL